MILTHVSLSDVRNYPTLDWSPAPGLNVLVGANAQGKSNLLEAVALLGTGKSFRTTHEGEVVRDGTAVATIQGEARLRAAASVRLACRIALTPSGVRKTYAANGRAVRYATYLGRIRVVTFIPGHLQLVSGPPSLRRAFLNAALAQDDRGYYAALAAYGKFLAQKSALLRGTTPVDLDLLDTYNERLVETGVTLVLARRAFIAALDERARGLYRSWGDAAEGTLELGYAPNVTYDAPTADGVGAAFAARLRAQRALELTRKMPLVGPHRDDLEFRLGARSLAAFGSQGQQRSAVLALKVAEYGVLEARAGEPPILLLDDVLSELDRERRRAFLLGIAGFQQAFVSATGEIEAPADAIFRVAAAGLEAVA